MYILIFWQDLVQHFPKKSKYTLGSKIDSTFLETIEIVFVASRTAKHQKLIIIQKAASKLDLLKFFIQIAWEVKALDNNKYIILSEPINEVGRMVGGWIRRIESETPVKTGERL